MKVSEKIVKLIVIRKDCCISSAVLRTVSVDRIPCKQMQLNYNLDKLLHHEYWHASAPLRNAWNRTFTQSITPSQGS